MNGNLGGFWELPKKLLGDLRPKKQQGLRIGDRQISDKRHGGRFSGNLVALLGCLSFIPRTSSLDEGLCNGRTHRSGNRSGRNKWKSAANYIRHNGRIPQWVEQ